MSKSTKKRLPDDEMINVLREDIHGLSYGQVILICRGVLASPEIVTQDDWERLNKWGRKKYGLLKCKWSTVHSLTIEQGLMNSDATLEELCHPANLAVVPKSVATEKDGISWLTIDVLRKRIAWYDKKFR